MMTKNELNLPVKANFFLKRFFFTGSASYHVEAAGPGNEPKPQQ